MLVHQRVNPYLESEWQKTLMISEKHDESRDESLADLQSHNQQTVGTTPWVIRYKYPLLLFDESILARAGQNTTNPYHSALLFRKIFTGHKANHKSLGSESAIAASGAPPNAKCQGSRFFWPKILLKSVPPP